MRDGDTIVALSSGSLPSGVAIIRVSGPQTRFLLEQVSGNVPQDRRLTLLTIGRSDEPLDRGLVVFFPSPNSFTGEDCAEFQVHGSPAVVRAILRLLTGFDGVRLAEAGEFTRRAFENGQLDLTEIEGLGDLIEAETENQRVQALARMAGGLSDQLTQWRVDLLDLRAEIEARLDFSDEGDVDEALPEDWFTKLEGLELSLKSALGDVARGRIVREGFRVALAGLPNAGKSSLLNALAKSNLAIVSDEAGTTRDVREVPLDLNGQLVIFVDMAGLRESESKAEAEGVRRAEAEITRADLVLWLFAPGASEEAFSGEVSVPLWCVATKSDLGDYSGGADYNVSVVTRDGLTELTDAISTLAQQVPLSGSPILVSRERDREALEKSLNLISDARVQLDAPEISAEALRLASDALARLLGKLDSEQVLDRLFSSFCIGK